MLVTVYKITNNINNKLYIGQTCNSLHSRFMAHCRQSNYSKLYRAIKKYGRQNFKIESLGTFSSREIANIVEDYFIETLEVRKYGYNIRYGGTTSKLSETTRKLLSEQKMGAKNPMFGKPGPWLGKKLPFKVTNWAAKKVICLNTNIIYESMKSAARDCGVSDVSIKQVCKGYKDQVKGLSFKYV